MLCCSLESVCMYPVCNIYLSQSKPSQSRLRNVGWLPWVGNLYTLWKEDWTSRWQGHFSLGHSKAIYGWRISYGSLWEGASRELPLGWLCCHGCVVAQCWSCWILNLIINSSTKLFPQVMFCQIAYFRGFHRVTIGSLTVGMLLWKTQKVRSDLKRLSCLDRPWTSGPIWTVCQYLQLQKGNFLC